MGVTSLMPTRDLEHITGSDNLFEMMNNPALPDVNLRRVTNIDLVDSPDPNESRKVWVCRVGDLYMQKDFSGLGKLETAQTFLKRSDAIDYEIQYIQKGNVVVIGDQSYAY